MDIQSNHIIRALSGERRSLNIKEISLNTGINRHAVARKLDTLEITGRVRKIQIGHSKKYYLVDPISPMNIFDINSDLVLVINQNWHIEYVNKNLRNQFNLSDNDILGKKLDKINLELFSSSDLFEGLKKYNAQKIIQMQIPWIFHDNEFWFRVSILNLPIKTEINLIAIVAINITEKKRTFKKIMDSEFQYRSLFEYAPVPLNEEDFSQVYKYISELKNNGIYNLKKHFSYNKEFVKECLKKIRIHSMNQESRLLFEIKSVEEYYPLFHLFPYLTCEGIETVKDILIDLCEGARTIKEEVSCAIGNHWANFCVHINVPQQSVGNLSRVYISYQNVTEKKLLEMLLQSNHIPDEKSDLFFENFECL